MATGVIDRDSSSSRKNSASQSNSQERRSSLDPNGSLGSKARRSHHDSIKREMIQNLADQYHAEKRRADDAERNLQELLINVKAINEARLQALYDAQKANEELK